MGSLAAITFHPQGYLIDDLEDGDGILLRHTLDEWQPPWRARWYDFHANVFLSPEPIIDGRGSWAMHLQGSGSQIDGGFGFDFENIAAVRCSGDCRPTNYLQDRSVSLGEFPSSTGIAFWARSSGPSAVVRVSILTPATLAEALGGACTEGCGLYFGRDFVVDAAWRHYAIEFAALAQPVPTGATLDFPLAIEFGTAEPSLDLWVDEIGFFRCAGPDCGPCDDGQQNGSETDLDCGGSECGPCGDGAACDVPADCWTACTSNLCVQCLSPTECML